MKTSTISTLSISSALQLTMSNTQKEITKVGKEAVDGTYYDVGAQLGVATSQSLDFSRESARLQAIVDANALAEQRMETSQLALEKMQESAQKIVNTFSALTASSGETVNKTAADTALAQLDAFLGLANSASKGEFLFSGINTDAQTLDGDFVADVTADFDTKLSAYMTANSITGTDKMTAAQMTSFLDGYMASFDWSSWTNASDTVMTSRISPTETVKTSTSINDDGFKNLVLSAVIGAQLAGKTLDSAARAVVTERVYTTAYQSVQGVISARSQIGLSQARVDTANESMSAQKTIIDTQLQNLVGVNQDEASSRLLLLSTQMELAYKITAKIQNLSLVNYL